MATASPVAVCLVSVSLRDGVREKWRLGDKSSMKV